MEHIAGMVLGVISGSRDDWWRAKGVNVSGTGNPLGLAL